MSQPASFLRLVRRLLPAIGLLTGLLSGNAAEPALGGWRCHFSYRNVQEVVAAGEKVYAAANGKLFSYEPSSQLMEDYNALTGLHGSDIVHLAWHEPSATLLLVYSDGNMDLLQDGFVTALSDYRDKSIAADKTVNRVRIYGEYACLATNVGALLLHVGRQEISETFMRRTAAGLYDPVQDFAILGNDYYLLTATGLFRGHRADNLADADNWEKLAFPSSLVPERLAVWRGKLWASVGTDVYSLEPEGWLLKLHYGVALEDMVVSAGCLSIKAGGCVMETRDAEAKLLKFGQDDLSSGVVLLDLSIDVRNGAVYAATGRNGLAVYRQASDGQYYLTEKSLYPNGPQVGVAWKMVVGGDALYVSGGGRWGDRYNWLGGAMCFKDDEWTSLVEPYEQIQAQTGLPFRDILNIAVDPLDERHVFATSWGEGLYEFQDGALVRLHSLDNSPLVSCLASNPYRYVRVDGATYDAQGNLWVLNSDPTFSKAGIHILKADGQWFSPHYANFPASDPSLDGILFHSNGQVWINSERSGSGLFVVDTNGSLENLSDDRSRWIRTFIDQDGRTVDIFTVHCLAEDHNGTLWVGTTHGPLLLYNPYRVFDTEPVFNRVKIPRNDGTNEADYLLDNARVYDIAVDGANRKWTATDNDGVYLLSPDGLETVHHFTKDNSPLPSDVVYSVAVHPATGEVFFGTELGLVSYRSDATEGAADYSRVHAFPNPVRPDYTGEVVVSGLQEGSQVKITDMNGRLLAAGTSLGGQFSWHLDAGSRVASGVYLVLVADRDGTTGVATKIVVVR